MIAPVAVPKLPTDMHTFEQRDGKRFMPLIRAKLWKSNGEPLSWHTEVKPMPSCNISIRSHRSAGALRIVISDAWYNWALLEGVPDDEIPMKDLATWAELQGDWFLNGIGHLFATAMQPQTYHIPLCEFSDQALFGLSVAIRTHDVE